MKTPKYFVETPQQASDIGINPFTLTLLAESFADNPGRFGDENMILLAHAHNGTRVWFVMSKTQPRTDDFTAHPQGSPLPVQPDPINPDILTALKECREVLHSCALDVCGTPSEEFFKAKVKHCDIVIAKAEGRNA